MSTKNKTVRAVLLGLGLGIGAAFSASGCTKKPAKVVASEAPGDGEPRTPGLPAPATHPDSAKHPGEQRAEAEAKPSPGAGAESPAPAGPPSDRPFPPADIAPPHERSAHEGDGRWQPLGNPDHAERAVTEPPVLYTTTLHPHPTSRFHSVEVVAIDLVRTRIGWMPGASDAGIEKLRRELSPGLVPPSELDRLIAVFNGGFLARHGWFGNMLEGKVLVEPREGSCTIALGKDHSVRMASWQEARAWVPELSAYRQTPPCLVEGGKLHPDLERHRERAWGGHAKDRKTRRRSALGLDRTGTILFYAVGIEVGARYLGEGMRLIGAEVAAQLDINWNWTRFVLFGKSGDSPELTQTSTFLDGMVKTKSGYVRRPEARDFFYLVLR